MTWAPIPDTVVIGITGHARHGKDEAARIIISTFPRLAQVFAFSDAISMYARVAMGMTKRDPRVLQTVGYERRELQPRIWLDALYWLIDERRPRVALITGVRFADEAQMVRDMGGTMIRIVRRHADGTPFEAGDRDANYPTEVGIDALPEDYVITNVTGDMAGFRDAVLSTYHVIASRFEEAAPV